MSQKREVRPQMIALELHILFYSYVCQISKSAVHFHVCNKILRIAAKNKPFLCIYHKIPAPKHHKALQLTSSVKYDGEIFKLSSFFVSDCSGALVKICGIMNSTK